MSVLEAPKLDLFTGGSPSGSTKVSKAQVTPPRPIKLASLGVVRQL